MEKRVRPQGKAGPEDAPASTPSGLDRYGRFSNLAPLSQNAEPEYLALASSPRPSGSARDGVLLA